MTGIYKALGISIFNVISALWVRTAINLAGPGAFRLVLAAPIVIANCFAPLIFDRVDEFILFACYLLLLVWLSNFKIIALAIDRGPLSIPSLSSTQFCILYALPITAKIDGRKGKMSQQKSNARFDHSAGSVTSLAGIWVMKFVLLLWVVYVLTTKDEWLPTLLAEFLEAFMLYWFLGLLMDGPAALIGWCTGMEISPHFDAPYLSASMAEFWSMRWNLTVGNLLRALCYDPIYEGRLVASDKSFEVTAFRRAIAICWSFIISGLMHEFLMWYIEPQAVTGEWLLFFVLQGPLLIAESLLKSFCRRQGIHIGKPYRIFLTLMGQLLLAHFFFFPPPSRNHVDDRFFRNVEAGTAALLQTLEQGLIRV